MNLDQEIREALMRHETDVREAPTAFDGIERKIRRNHQRRIAAAGTFVIALLVAGAASVIALRSGEDRGFVSPDDDRERVPNEAFPTGPNFPSECPYPPSGWIFNWSCRFWDQDAGYALRVPQEWKVTEFEGNVELYHRTETGLAVGEDTFVIEVQMRIGESGTDIDLLPGTITSEREITMAGQPARRVDYERAPGSMGVFYLVDWPSSFCRPAGCGDDPNTLLIHIVSSTRGHWEKYGDDAVRDVENLMTTADLMTFTAREVNEQRGPFPVLTRRGGIDGTITIDDRVQLLVRFLEARVRGIGAEDFMAPGVRTEGYGLYAFDDDEFPYVTYTLDRCSVSGDTATCNVTLVDREDGRYCCLTQEIIEIGPQRDELKILSIVEEGASPPGGP